MKHIICAAIMLVSAALTPWTIKHAYEFRGYAAIGGEYMIIPLGIVLSIFVLTIADIHQTIVDEEQECGL